MLDGLPTELLLEISLYLQGDEVSQICLALTCRKMYANIIPEARKEHAQYVQDFLIPVGFLGIYKSEMAVVPRHKSIHGVKLSVLYTEATVNSEAGQAFQGNIGTVNIWLMPKECKDIRAVRSLLMSAPALKHIHLQIPSSCQWKVVVNTLNICAARPSTRLTITDSLPHWSRQITPILGRTTSSMLDKSPSVDTSWSSKSRLSEALRRMRGGIQPQETPRITALSIENDVLFFFEIYPLLLRLINTAPLKSLHLGRSSAYQVRVNVPPLRQTHWATILSSITTRATRVAFTSVPLAPEDLLAFLARHSHITHLGLDISTLTGGVLFKSTPRLLQNLTTLEGTASTVLPFLTAREDGHLPVLQHLILQTHLVKFEAHDVENHRLHTVYDHITRHEFAYTSIQVPSLCRSGLLSWIFSSSTDPSASGDYHYTPQRSLLNIKKVIFKHSDTQIPPSVRRATEAWSGEKVDNEDQGSISASAVVCIVVNVIRRAFPEVDFELLHLLEVPASAVEIMGSSLTPGSA